MALPEHYHESPKYKLIITSLLANFVAVYCEYKGGNTEIASLFNSLYNMFPDKEKNEEREKSSPNTIYRDRQAVGYFQ